MVASPAEQEAAVTSVVLDYFEGWFEGDAGRMARALHPGLAKRALRGDGQTLAESPAEWMIEATDRGEGRDERPDDLTIDVTVEDVHGDIACATVRSTVYREYLHLARTLDGWKIVNALWTPTRAA